MSDYLTLAEAKARLSDDIQETLWYDSTIPAVNDTWITDDIKAAESDVNAYINRRYATPVTSERSITLLKEITFDIFLSRSYKVRGSSGIAPSGVQDQDDITREKLKDINKGIIILPDADENSHSTGSRTFMQSNKQIMTRKNLECF